MNSLKTKIERGIPMPPRYAASGSGIMSVLRELKVGDSFVWPRKQTAGRSNDLYLYARRLNIRLSIRKVSTTKNRVWRVS